VEALAIANSPGRPGLEEEVERAQAGDLQAFESVYRRHAGRVYAICLRMSADPARAEDLTQETFIRAWEKLASFRGDSPFQAWLRRLTVNVVLADRRSSGRRSSRETATDRIARFPERTLAAQPGRAIDLETAISRLPEGARRVFVLHDVEGYRHDEIADMLGVATGTSKTQLHRARRLLREALRS
jgi:RNA polymerase sigma-70 factor (ECF subfamily)